MAQNKPIRRWLKHQSTHGENPKIDAFLHDIMMVCNKHKLILSHEDHHGAFEVVDLTPQTRENNGAWLMDAHDCTEPK